MAIVIPVGKLVKGISEIGSNEPIYVKLKNNNTVYKDRVTGWTIVGSEIKELPQDSASHSISQSLLLAIRAGRFIRVKTEVTPKGKKRKKYEELVDSIIKEYDAVYNILGEKVSE